VIQRIVDVATLTRMAALLCVAFFLLTSFRYGWNRDATDFRNYYTGAVAVSKREPLKNYYDANWFESRLNDAGIRALGSYIPQTPLGMLPLIPLSPFPIQQAKHMWLVFNLMLLVGVIWMISRLTALTYSTVNLLAFTGYWTLHVNFLFGQYYVCLLFLITASLFCLEQHWDRIAGVLLSTALALKLYGGPFLLYLGVKRRWRATLWMVGGAVFFWQWRSGYSGGRIYCISGRAYFPVP
jgi:hypothetical protein